MRGVIEFIKKHIEVITGFSYIIFAVFGIITRLVSPYPHKMYYFLLAFLVVAILFDMCSAIINYNKKGILLALLYAASFICGLLCIITFNISRRCSRFLLLICFLSFCLAGILKSFWDTDNADKKSTEK